MSPSFISRRLAIVLVTISALSLLGVMLLFAFSSDLRNDYSYDADVTSRSAVGFAGLKQLLMLSGTPTEVDRGPLMRARTTPSLVILTPSGGTAPKDIAAYEFSAPTLIILPKWIALPIPTHPEWAMKRGIEPDKTVAQLLRNLGGTITVITRAGSTHNFQTIAGPAMPQDVAPVPIGHVEALRTIAGLPSVLIARDYGPVLGAISGHGQPVYVLSEPDLMNNLGLADAATARGALAIVASLRKGGGPIRFDVTLNGLGRDPSLLRAVFEPPFLGATISALLTVLLIALHAASRFGAPRHSTAAIARGKKMLAANTADLLRIMGREGAMAGRYVQSARDLALARLGARRGAAPEQEELLAILERGNNLQVSYGELVREAQRARTANDLLRIAAKAYAWRKGITRGY